jgi:hypothetical protein
MLIKRILEESNQIALFNQVSRSQVVNFMRSQDKKKLLTPKKLQEEPEKKTSSDEGEQDEEGNAQGESEGEENEEESSDHEMMDAVDENGTAEDEGEEDEGDLKSSNGEMTENTEEIEEKFKELRAPNIDSSTRTPKHEIPEEVQPLMQFLKEKKKGKKIQ